LKANIYKKNELSKIKLYRKQAMEIDGAGQGLKVRSALFIVFADAKGHPRTAFIII
jgi:hypothetical protein